MSKLTHIDSRNQPRMVDVSNKKVTQRCAVARSRIEIKSDLSEHLSSGDLQSPKGPVFHTAIVAGTMAAKNTGNLIPFCHPIGMNSCHITIEFIEPQVIEILCEVIVEGKTGIEMEALTGASVASLTIYDMCKAFGSEMCILETRLLKKTGGKKDYEHES